MIEAKIEEAKIVKVYSKSVWVESDLMGSRHVMVQHEGDEQPFRYCSFHYDYRYTDNASTLTSAEDVALMLGAEKPVQHKLDTALSIIEDLGCQDATE